MSPVVHSSSERRDIKHNSAMLEFLEPLCAEYKPDLIWERSYRLHCPGLEMAKRLGVPFVLEWKDHLVDYPLSLYKARALRLEAMKNEQANYLVVESEVLRDQLGLEGVDKKKIIVAHNAVYADQFGRNVDKRAKARKELGIDDETVLVGYLGSYAFYHDAPRLVLAADILKRSEVAGRTKVLMVGAGKEYPESLRLAQQLCLLNDIVIMKPGVPKEEVPGVLAALDIAILPGSTDIICPIKVQEYMACELPSIVPDYPCNREVLQNGETGLLFRPKDGMALAESISLLVKDEKLRESIGKRAREEVIQRFSWEATWGAALQQILDPQ